MPQCIRTGLIVCIRFLFCNRIIIIIHTSNESKFRPSSQLTDYLTISRHHVTTHYSQLNTHYPLLKKVPAAGLPDSPDTCRAHYPRYRSAGQASRPASLNKVYFPVSLLNTHYSLLKKYRRPDSNRHGHFDVHWILSPTCLPIPPRRQKLITCCPKSTYIL